MILNINKKVLSEFYKFWIKYESLANFAYWWNFGSMALICLINITVSGFCLLWFYNFFEAVNFININNLIVWGILLYVIVELNSEALVLMRRIGGGEIWFRIYTKKKFFKKYCPKRQYSANIENNAYIVNKKHIHEVILPMEIEQKQVVSDVFNKVIIENGMVQKVAGLDKEIYNKYINKTINNEYKIEEETNKYFKGYEKKEVLKVVNNYKNNIINSKKYEKGLGFISHNYTTSFKNAKPIINPGKIVEQPLNKGVYMYTGSAMFNQIYSDKDFIQVYLYIIENIEDDLKQRIMIQNNTHITDVEKLYNAQAKKILRQIGIKQIIIENKITTKQELLEYLYNNWEKIRE